MSTPETNFTQVLCDIIESKVSDVRRAAIFTHAQPDPDAIASMMALQFLLQKQFGIESDLFYKGVLSHPQQNAIKNLLEPGMLLLPDRPYDKSNYQFNFLVDTCVSNAGVDQKVDFDLVIDHHPSNGSNGCPVINLRAGSCAGTVYHLIKSFEIPFDENEEYDCRVATAIMIGVFSDTDGFVSDDTTDFEHIAFADMFRYRVPATWKQIVKYKIPKTWVILKSAASTKVTYDDNRAGIALYGMGRLTEKETDLLAITADEMLSWASVEIAITYAIIDGTRIEGCIRTINPSYSIPDICKALGSSKGGDGWGKIWKGRYRFPLGGFSIDADEDEDLSEKTWSLIDERERKRILKFVQK